METRLSKFKSKRDYIYSLEEDDQNVANFIDDLNIIDPSFFKDCTIHSSVVNFQSNNFSTTKINSKVRKTNLSKILKEIQIDSYLWDNKRINYSRIYNKNKKNYKNKHQKNQIFLQKNFVISLFIVIILVSIIYLILMR